MKLLRTIRLDPSDTFVFDHAAEPGEWAVTGTFMFAEADLAALEGKARTAFRAGFLGTASLGWSTLVQIVEAGEDDHRAAVDTLIAMHRTHDGGEIRETFRTLRPKDGPKPLRAFSFLDVEGDDEPAERVDLAAMAKNEKSEK